VTITTNTENKNQRQHKICELQHPSVLSASRKKKEKMPMKCREISDDDNKRKN
jgi:hypothetical protein